MEGPFWVTSGADFSITNYALPFEYVHGSVSVCDRPSDSLQLEIIPFGGKLSAADSTDLVCCGAQLCQGNIEEFGNSAT